MSLPWSFQKQKKTPRSYCLTALFTVAVHMCIVQLQSSSVKNVSYTTGLCFLCAILSKYFVAKQVLQTRQFGKPQVLVSWKRLILIRTLSTLISHIHIHHCGQVYSKKLCLINPLLTSLLSLEFIAAHCKGMLSL
jgi:predicted transporter